LEIKVPNVSLIDERGARREARERRSVGEMTEESTTKGW
jgi:hypothetical protein